MVVKNAHIFIKSRGLWSGADKITIEKIINTPPSAGVPSLDKWVTGPSDLIGWPDGKSLFCKLIQYGIIKKTIRKEEIRAKPDLKEI